MVLIFAFLLIVLSGCDLSADSGPTHPPFEIAVLEDSQGRLSIEQVAASTMAPEFAVKSCNRMSAGFSRSYLWVRVPLQRPEAVGSLLLELAAPWMEEVELYLPRQEGGWSRQSTGLKLKPSLQTKPAFLLPVPAETPRDKPPYLRLKSELSLNTGLRLWTRPEFEAQAVKKAYVFGLLYGIMGAMLLVNLVIFLASRGRAYLFYILYLAGMLGHQMCLQGQVLFLPVGFWPFVPQLSLGLASAVFFFGAAFCRAFLHAEVYAPLSNRLLRGIQAGSDLSAGLDDPPAGEHGLGGLEHGGPDFQSAAPDNTHLCRGIGEHPAFPG